MNLINVCKKKIKNYLGVPDYNPEPRRMESKLPTHKGVLLFSYIDAPLFWNENDSRLNGHSNNWESREIAKIFNELGFAVDAISWSDQFFYPDKRSYDVIFDIHTNLQRWAPFVSSSCKKILHITGSYFRFQKDAELARVAALEARTGKLYSPKRIASDLDLAERSYRLADTCSLIGNKVTFDTFPLEYKKKITPIPVSGSRLDYVKSIREEYIPASREFLWFYGGGAVHKGLDLVLEVFARNPHLKLHVVAKLESERDFFKIYSNHFGLPNITYHGYLHPSSYQFKELGSKIFANIAPSCSEGISPATVTCMQYGFYPIISRHNGITLPDRAGMYLETCSIDEIEQRVIEAYEAPTDLLVEQIRVAQTFALHEYSRENFSQKMRAFLIQSLGL
ncbi:glycosyltransferase family 4 protein [Candidatus Dependentiae bacterium]|nr:glycosyltransferase family 4 protein [Candidatus Dependentiae bacterium]